jgi:hypothetical protein
VLVDSKRCQQYSCIKVKKTYFEVTYFSNVKGTTIKKENDRLTENNRFQV